MLKNLEGHEMNTNLPRHLFLKHALSYLKTVYNIEIKYETFKYWCYTGKVPIEKRGRQTFIEVEVLDKIGKNFKGFQKGGRPKWAVAHKRSMLIPALLSS